MEIITFNQCACANCGYVMEYRTSDAGTIIECAKCHDKSALPEVASLLMVEVEGPPIPKTRICDACSEQFKFTLEKCPFCAAKAKRKRAVQLTAVGGTFLAIAAVGYFLFQQHTQVAARAAAAAEAAKPASHRGQVMIISQPAVSQPKSKSDLKPGQFWLERNKGSQMAVAVGDIQNNSENLHENLQADVELLDRKGAKIGVVSDYAMQLGPHQSWHVVVAVDDTNAINARFLSVKEKQY